MKSVRRALPGARLRPRLRGWWISGLLHGLLLLTLVQLGRDSDSAPPWIAVELVRPTEPSDDQNTDHSADEVALERLAREDAAATQRLVSRTPVLPRERVQAPTTRPLPTPTPTPTELPPTTRETRSQVLFDRVATKWWSERSLAKWIEECRAGQSTPDSTLERPRTIHERGRERTVASLNREFHARRWQWELERFQEAYVRNFPLMR